jgi:hypothetical protein
MAQGIGTVEETDDGFLSMDELIDIQRRNLAIVRSSWDAKEKESARLVARIAAEMFVERIKSF